MKQRPKPVVRSFSPALSALIESLIAETNQKVLMALEREAQHLGFPKGTQFDVQARVWTLPPK